MGAGGGAGTTAQWLGVCPAFGGDPDGVPSPSQLPVFPALG